MWQRTCFSSIPAAVSARGCYNSWFDAERRRVMRDLRLNLNDRSEIGVVDKGVVSCIDAINANSEYYTVSSCSGRIALFHRSCRCSDFEPVLKLKAKRGAGKGTLFCSHESLPEPKEVGSRLARLVQTLVEEQRGRETCNEMLELKFEPMILHIICRSESAADNVVKAAFSSGFRRSGFWRSPVRLNQQPKGFTIMPRYFRITACVSGSFGFNNIVMMNKDVLLESAFDSCGWVALLDHCNNLLHINESRKLRFLREFATICGTVHC